MSAPTPFVYASRTGTRRNLEAIARAGFGLMIAPGSGSWNAHGLRYALDNGAWGAHTAKKPWDPAPFERMLEARAADADWAVLPDIVGGGARSLDFSLSWWPRLRGMCRFMAAVQDGVGDEAVLTLPPELGIFLGGTTEWKEANIFRFALIARAQGRAYHVGRVNSRRRYVACAAAGADSVDGSSVSRFAVNAPRVAAWQAQPPLFDPRGGSCG